MWPSKVEPMLTEHTYSCEQMSIFDKYLAISHLLLQIDILFNIYTCHITDPWCIHWECQHAVTNQPNGCRRNLQQIPEVWKPNLWWRIHIWRDRSVADEMWKVRRPSLGEQPHWHGESHGTWYVPTLLSFALTVQWIDIASAALHSTKGRIFSTFCKS